MQNSSYRNKITFNSTSKIHRIYFHETLYKIETFGPNEPEKFHEIEPHLAFSWNLYLTVCESKGNEQVLGRNKSWEKENKILWVVLFLF
jgi:hypothetical protein